MAAFGIHMGGYVHVIAAALGLALLFKAIPLLYVGMKLVGAAYLVWLGLQFIFVKQSLAASRADEEPKSTRQAFWESATVEILNPKTALFFVAFLPQFTDPSALLPLWAQLLVLGVFVNLMFSSADLLCVFLAEWLTRALRQSSNASRWANRIGGGILVALGIHLATIS